MVHTREYVRYCIANNVNQFKNRLDKHWKMHDIIFNYRADYAETGGRSGVS